MYHRRARLAPRLEQQRDVPFCLGVIARQGRVRHSLLHVDDDERRATPAHASILFGISPARWLARNSITRNSASPCWWNGSSWISVSISCLLLPTARMIPPSRGIFRPETRKVPSA